MSPEGIHSVGALNYNTVGKLKVSEDVQKNHKPEITSSTDNGQVYEPTIKIDDQVLTTLSAIYPNTNEDTIEGAIHQLNKEKPCPSCDFVLPPLKTLLPQQTTNIQQNEILDLTGPSATPNQAVHVVKLSDEDLKLLKLAKALLILDKASTTDDPEVTAGLEDVIKTTPLKSKSDVSFKGSMTEPPVSLQEQAEIASPLTNSIKHEKQSLNSPTLSGGYSAVDPTELYRLVNILEQERQSMGSQQQTELNTMRNNQLEIQKSNLQAMEAMQNHPEGNTSQDAYNQQIQEALKRVMLYQSVLNEYTPNNLLYQNTLTPNSLISYPMGNVLMLSDSLYKMFENMGYGYAAAGIDPLIANNAFISYNMENGAFYPSTDGMSIMFDPYKEYRWPSLDYMTHYKDTYGHSQDYISPKVGILDNKTEAPEQQKDTLAGEPSFEGKLVPQEADQALLSENSEGIPADTVEVKEIAHDPISLKHKGDKNSGNVKFDLAYNKDFEAVNAFFATNESLTLNADKSKFKVKGEDGKKHKVDLKEAQTLNVLAGRNVDNKKGLSGKFENFTNYNLHLDRDNINVEAKAKKDQTSFISAKTYGDKGKLKTSGSNKGDIIHNQIEGYKQEIEIKADKDKGKGGSDVISVVTSSSARENKIKILPGNPDFAKEGKYKKASAFGDLVDVTVDGNKNKFEIKDDNLDKKLKHNADINLNFKVSKDKIKIEDKGDKIKVQDPFGNVVEIRKNLIKSLSINGELPENGWNFDKK